MCQDYFTHKSVVSLVMARKIKMHCIKILHMSFYSVSQAEIDRDFRELRKTVEDSGWMKVNPVFYVCHLLSILGIEFLGYMILSRFGTSWLPYIAAAVCFTTAQVNV